MADRLSVKNLITLFLIGLFLSSCALAPSRVSWRSPSAIESYSCRDIIRSFTGTGNSFLKSKKNFSKSLKKTYTPSQAKVASNNLDALLFIDYTHSVDALSDIYSGKVPLHKSSFFKTYENAPFKNYLKTSDYLQRYEPDFSLSTLKKVHKRMMAGNVDGIATRDLGKIRSDVIIGNIPIDEPIDINAFKNLDENPYISTAWIKTNSEGYFGEIGYPNPMEFTDHVGKRLKSIDRNLYNRVVEYRDSEVGDLDELTREMVNALTEDLLDWFVKKRSQIGPLDNTRNFKKYARTVAEFQRNLISIHPFADGNGRTVRQFGLYYPFWLEGLPPPRLSNPDADIYTSLDQWTDQIIEGVENTKHLYDSLSERVSRGLSLETTPELLFPSIPNKITIHKRIQKPRKLIKDYKSESIDPSQYAEYMRQRMLDPEFDMESYKATPYLSIQKMTKDFEKFYQTSRLDYLHPKFGEERLQLGFADRDFIKMFGDKSYKDRARFDYKMERWYDKKIIWRGLSYQRSSVKETEIVSMFTDVHDQFVSNNIMGVRGNKVKLAKSELEKYNEDLVHGGLARMAQDHSDSGPLYGESYGYSTSSKRQVGKAFAMGAMVIAEYGEHHDYQHLLKSRVLVGMKKSVKDVDLSRLKQMRPEFSYHYPRQKEIMGIGAADPDAVSFVQTIDAEGEVILSYVRNPKNPKEILVFDKEVSDLSKVPRKPIRKIQLK